MNKRIELLKSLHSRHKFDKVYVEGIAGFKDFVAELKRTTNLPVNEISNVKDKISNLETNSYKFESRRVHFNNKIEANLLEELIEQFTTNHPKHDDMRDAVLLAIKEEQGNVSSEVW